MKKEEIIQIYSKYQLIISPILIAISSIILIIFVIYPQTIKLLSNNEKEKEINQKYSSLDVKASELQTVNSGDLKDSVDLVLVVYPTEKDYSNAIGLIQRLMAEHSFSLNNLSLTAGASEKGVSSYAVKVEFEGQRNSLDGLLNSIENAPRVMKVISIDILSNREADTIEGSLVIEVLFSQLPKSLGALDDPLPKLNEQEESLLTELQRSATSFVQNATSIGQRGKANPFE